MLYSPLVSTMASKQKHVRLLTDIRCNRTIYIIYYADNPKTSNRPEAIQAWTMESWAILRSSQYDSYRLVAPYFACTMLSSEYP